MNDKIVLVGAGGHCKACIDVIEAEGKFSIAGVLEKDERLKGNQLMGYRILGGDEMIDELAAQGLCFLVTVGQIKSPLTRKKIFQKLESLNASCPVITSPYAYVSRHATIGKGTIIMHNAIVNAGATVGVNCILNTGCIIEHDALIGHHSHISTRAVINGDCTIGNEVFVGSGTVVANGKSIADGVVLGGACYVHKNIFRQGVYIDQRKNKLLLH